MGKSTFFLTKARTLIFAGGLLDGLLIGSDEGRAEPGVLTQPGELGGCISLDGSSGLCTDGEAIAGTTSVAVSPDGKHVYVASYDGSAVAVLTREK